MGDDAVPIIATVAAIAIDIGLVVLIAGTGGLATPLAIAGFAATGAIAFSVTSFLVGDDPSTPIFSPSGIGGSAGPRGTVTGGKSFASTGDGGFRRTSTSPQSPEPIIIGTYMVSGTVLDSFPLGENNKRSFQVVGIAKPPITQVKTLVDNIDITTLPNFIDVTAGGTPDDNKPYMQYFGNGGASGDRVLNNSGKKRFNIQVDAGDIGNTPDVYFFTVASGKNEARIFLSVNVPTVYLESLTTVNASYASLTGKTLTVSHVVAGAVVDITETVTFTDAMKTSSPDYTGLDGLTMIFDVDGDTNRTVTFTASETDAATVAAKIDSDIGGFVTAAVDGTDVIVYNDTHTAAGTIVVDGASTAQAKLGFAAFNDATSAENNISNQTGAGLIISIVSVDEIKFESANDDNKRLLFDISATGYDQLNIAEKNYGTTISYTLSKQEQGSSTITPIVTETNRKIDRVVNAQAQPVTVLIGLQRLETENAAFALTGLDLDVTVAGVIRTVTFTAGATNAVTTVDEINDQIGTWVTALIINTDEIRIVTATGGLSVSGPANAQLNFSVVTGDFFFDTSIPNSGFWSFVLEVDKASNGATINIAIVEVMSDFIQTEDGDFSDISGQTLIMEDNDGVQQTVTFGVDTSTAALAIVDINDQLGALMTATASGTEILIEALPLPVGTETIPEAKQIKVIGGTAAEDMNFKSIYSETKTYNYQVAYAIINLVKNNRISANPQFIFEATGVDDNPAQILLDIFEGNGPYFKPGLNIRREIDRNSFINSIAFCDAEGLTANTGILDSSYGETVESLRIAGSLMKFENGGITKIIPETDSQVAAELHVTDDFRLDGIIKNSWSWATVDETRKFNLLRVTYPDAVKDYISRDIVIDVTGEVDTENGEVPRMFEKGELININDSELDSLRASARNFPAVTSRIQALRLGRQIFKKQNLGAVAFSCEVSIRHVFLERGDIISLFIDELGFIGKKFRILEIKESNNFGYVLGLSEHSPEMYSF